MGCCLINPGAHFTWGVTLPWRLDWSPGVCDLSRALVTHPCLLVSMEISQGIFEHVGLKKDLKSSLCKLGLPEEQQKEGT